MAKMKAGKKDTRAGKGDADLSKGRGNVLPATADGSIPLPAEKPEKGKRGNGGQAAEQERAAPSRPAHWNTGWYNHQNKPILIEPAPKRSLIDEVDKPSQTGPSKGKGKKAQKKAPAKGRKGAKGDEGDRPVFRRIRKMSWLALLVL